MGNQRLHRRETTTERTRKSIQESKESITKLAQRYGISRATAHKWKKRETTEDQRPGPAKGYGSRISKEEEMIICEVRKMSKLPLDDLLAALSGVKADLSRAGLYRCLKRNGLDKLEKEPKRIKREVQKFEETEIGFVHIDSCEISFEWGKAIVFAGIDRRSKLCYIEVQKDRKMETAKGFMERMLKFFPYEIRTILTDNGSEFTHAAQQDQPKEGKEHPFEEVCKENGVEHRKTKIKHPWTNGQVERMNRSLKSWTVERYYYENFETLKKDLLARVDEYNHLRKLRSINSLTPWQASIFFANLSINTSPSYLSLIPYTPRMGAFE